MPEHPTWARERAAIDRSAQEAVQKVEAAIGLLQEDRDRLLGLMSYEASGVARLAAHAEQSGRPFTCVFEPASKTWRVTYGFGSSPGVGMSLDEACRGAVDQAEAAA